MAYYLHRLRCWVALMRAMWAEAGAAGKCAECRYERDIARKRWERQQELARQLVEMRRVRP